MLVCILRTPCTLYGIIATSRPWGECRSFRRCLGWGLCFRCMCLPVCNSIFAGRCVWLAQNLMTGVAAIISESIPWPSHILFCSSSWWVLVAVHILSHISCGRVVSSICACGDSSYAAIPFDFASVQSIGGTCRDICASATFPFIFKCPLGFWG